MSQRALSMRKIKEVLRLRERDHLVTSAVPRRRRTTRWGLKPFCERKEFFVA